MNSGNRISLTSGINLLAATAVIALGLCGLNNLPPQVTFHGCTPGDRFLKHVLAIPEKDSIDFMRWTIDLDSSARKFTLRTQFGLSQPNTLGFKNGGSTKTATGEFVRSVDTKLQVPMITLNSSQFAKPMRLIVLNDNILHFLDDTGKLAVGNGGWSYSLNKSGSTGSLSTEASSTTRPTPVHATFDGRTPCQEIANEYGMHVSNACFKLKWRIVLDRDSLTASPKTFTMRQVVDNKPQAVTGKWEITKTKKGQPIYVLTPETKGSIVYLLPVTDDVLFFTDKEGKMLTGNGEFSFTLNKVR